MKHCPNCHRTYPDTANFCQLDGKQLVSDTPPVAMRCPSCQRTYGLDARFCLADGTPLVTVPPAPEVESTAPAAGDSAHAAVPATSAPTPQTNASLPPTSPETSGAKINATTAEGGAAATSSTATPRSEKQEAFAKAMMQWFEDNDFHIGLDGQSDDKRSALADALGHMGAPGLEQVLPALLPFTSLADVLGPKIHGGNVQLALVIFADDLKPEEILRRCDQLIELAKPFTDLVLNIGLGVGYKSQGAASLFPLLVYFDAAKCASDMAVVMPHAQQLKFWQRVHLTAAFVNMAERTVTWPPASGLAGVSRKMEGFLHDKQDPFDTADLQRVLSSM